MEALQDAKTKGFEKGREWMDTASKATGEASALVKKHGERAATYVKSNRSTFIIIGSILLIAGIIAAIILIRRAKARQHHQYLKLFLLREPVSGMSDTQIGAEYFPQGKETYTWTMSLHLYVNDWQYRYGVYKQVCSKGNPKHACPSLYLAPSINDVVWSIYTDKGRFNEYWVRDIDLRRWCHFGISIQDHKVDVYYKGKLVSSNVLAALPQIDHTSPFSIGGAGGFSGLVAHVHYSSTYATPEDMERWASWNPSTKEKYFESAFR